jgi:hypothetical protein
VGNLLILFNWLGKVPALAAIYGRRNENSGLTGGGEFYDFLSDCGQVNEELPHEIIQ